MAGCMFSWNAPIDIASRPLKEEKRVEGIGAIAHIQVHHEAKEKERKREREERR